MIPIGGTQNPAIPKMIAKMNDAIDKYILVFSFICQ